MSYYRRFDLIHYRESSFSFDPSRTYWQNPDDFKPHGLWVSVEDGNGWADWCRTEEFNVESLGYCYKLVLSPDARILTLENIDDIEAFQKWYGHRKHEFIHTLNWERVAQDGFQGVMFAPYEKELSYMRVDKTWYYSIDCSSGCIWDLSVIDTYSSIVGSYARS